MARRNGDVTEELLPEHSSEFRFQEYVTLLLRGKWIMLASILLLTALMLIYTMRSRTVYEASAQVLVDTKANAQRLPIGTTVDNNADNKVANDLGILRSRALAHEVALTLLEHPYLDDSLHLLLSIVSTTTAGDTTVRFADTAEVTDRVIGRMDFVPERESDIIRITAESNDPREAAILANRYAEAYQNYNLDASRARSKSLREFLESRLSEQGSALARAEGSLKGFLESSGAVAMDGESNKVVQELSQLEAMRNAIDIDVQTQTQKLASMRKELPEQQENLANSVSESDDSYIRLLQEQLAKLEVQRDVITVQNDPKVIGEEMYAQKLQGIQNQVTALRGKLKAKTQHLAGSILPEGNVDPQSDPLTYIRTLREKIFEGRLELVGLQSRREALQNIISGYEARFQKIPARSLELARLQRERASAEKLYLMVEEKFNEAAITEKSEFGNVEVIDKASVPDSPVSPNLRLNLLIGILGGIGLGVVILLLRDALDARVRTPEQLRRRGYFPLTEIAPMQGELRRLHQANDGASEQARLDEHLWLLFNPFSFLAESYRRLRTNLLRLQRENRFQVILMTGPNPQEGKTTTLTNLAVVLAETQKRVLLIDADLRRPRVHELLKLACGPGLTDLLESKITRDQAIHRNVFENLDVICSGSPCKQPSTLFAGKKLALMLEEFRRVYEWILIDGAPILVVNDAAMISALADGTILTVSAGKTRMAALQRAVEFLENAGGRMIGTVLNNFDAKRVYGGFYGGQGYGHYSHESKYYTPANGKSRLASQA